MNKIIKIFFSNIFFSNIFFLLSCFIFFCIAYANDGTLSSKSYDDKYKITSDENKSQVMLLKANNKYENKNIWVYISKNLKSNKLINKRISKELKWYTSNPFYFDQLSKKAAPYLYYVVHEVRKRRLPMELALLPAVESSFDPYAYSSAGASGLWQFMSSTGEDYKLKKNWWNDERRDIVKSTTAALDYLSRLYKAFGSWELALAAFNSGPGRVQRAIDNNRKKNKPIDFWSLDLPNETTAYVPKLIALNRVIKNPEKYNIMLDPIENKPYFVSVKSVRQVDINYIADIIGVGKTELYRLNPGLNHWVTPPGNNSSLLIPRKKLKKFQESIGLILKEKFMSWEHYIVRGGDSLSAISNKFNTKVSLIKIVNLLDKDVIYKGQHLIIPNQNIFYNDDYLINIEKEKNGKFSLVKRKKVDYIVKKGDNLWDLSKKFGVSLKSLMTWNNILLNQSLEIGKKIIVWIKY